MKISYGKVRYAKFEQGRVNSTELKVHKYRLIENGSIELADMQQLSKFKKRKMSLFVAVEKFSHLLLVVPLQHKRAKALSTSSVRR